MKFSLALVALASLASTASFAADAPKPTAQVTGLVRLVKPDGKTVIAQAKPALLVGTSLSGALGEINVTDKDAFIAMLGKCAFNFQYDEVSSTAVSGSTNRIYDNDALVAINSQIALSPNVVKTVWTQPYLKAGRNVVRVVVNADSAAPSTGLVVINVAGTCGATAAPAPTPAPTPAPAPTIQPGSADWNNLYTAWGYSNYAVTQLKGKGYKGYDDLVKLNAAFTAAVNAKKIGTADYAELMKRWNALTTDPAFKAAMAAITPTSGK